MFVVITKKCKIIYCSGTSHFDNHFTFAKLHEVYLTTLDDLTLYKSEQAEIRITSIYGIISIDAQFNHSHHIVNFINCKIFPFVLEKHEKSAMQTPEKIFKFVKEEFEFSFPNSVIESKKL